MKDGWIEAMVTGRESCDEDLRLLCRDGGETRSYGDSERDRESEAGNFFLRCQSEREIERKREQKWGRRQQRICICCCAANRKRNGGLYEKHR